MRGPVGDRRVASGSRGAKELTLDESELLRELGKRLDLIEDYLGRLGQVSGFPFAPYRAGQGIGSTDSFGSFGSAPASFGPAARFGDMRSSSPSPAVQAQGPGSGVPPELVALARSGKMILAIKHYREMSGLGLKEAKAEVEAAVRLPR